MRLYSGPISLFTAKSRIVLAEKGLDYERIEVGYSFEHAYEPHHPDVDRLNPLGRVPILVDEDVVVYDSTLIDEYLEERSPEPPLMPRERRERARCRQLEAYADEVLFPHVWVLIEETIYAGGERASDAGRLEQARARIDDCLAYLDRELEGRAYFCGAFSLADIAVFVIVNAARTLGATVPDRLANLVAWLARVAERPAVAAELAEMGAFFAAQARQTARSA